MNTLKIESRPSWEDKELYTTSDGKHFTMKAPAESWQRYLDEQLRLAAQAAQENTVETDNSSKK